METGGWETLAWKRDWGMLCQPLSADVLPRSAAERLAPVR